MAKTKQSAPFIHSRTFFNHDRWSAHDHIGVLLGRGITQVSVALQGNDWVVSWPERTPPDVVAEALETPA